MNKVAFLNLLQILNIERIYSVSRTDDSFNQAFIRFINERYSHSMREMFDICDDIIEARLKEKDVFNEKEMLDSLEEIIKYSNERVRTKFSSFYN